MAKKRTTTTTTKEDPAAALRSFALSYPGAAESIACEGTALEKRTVKAGSKAFVFIGRTDLMVKLGASLPEAEALAARAPGSCKVGAHGWATVQLGAGSPVAADVLERWIDESYRLLAGKKLLAELLAARPRGG